MAISFPIAGVGTASTTFATQATLGIPAGVVAHDLLFLGVTGVGSLGDPVVTDNDTGGNAWAKVQSGNNGTSVAAVFWKRATVATASKTITVDDDPADATTSICCALAIVRGGSMATPPYTDQTYESNISGDEIHGSITPDNNGAAVFLSVHNATNDIEPDSQTTTDGDPGALTGVNAYGESTAGTDCSVELAAAVMATINATGNITWAQVDAASMSIAWAVNPLLPSEIGGMWSHGYRMPSSRELVTEGVNFRVSIAVPAWDPSTAGAWLHGDRVRARAWWTSPPAQIGWWYPTLPVVWDPSVAGSWLHGERMRGRRWYASEYTNPPRVPVPIFDPTLWGGIGQGGERVRLHSRIIPPIPDPIGWWFPYVPAVFDPALYPPSIQLAGSFRTGQSWSSDTVSGWSFVGVEDAPAAFDPALYVPAIGGYGSVWVRRIPWTGTEEVSSGFGVPIPYLPQIEHLWRSFRLGRWRRWYSADPMPDAWIFTVVPPFVPPQSGQSWLMMRARRREEA